MRLIDADKFIEDERKRCFGEPVVGTCTMDNIYLSVVLEDAETVDSEPVRHGKWGMNSDRPDTIICSVCDHTFDVWKHESKDFNYCPHCGAKMDAE